ncbi:MAG TPA: RNA polymerase sigma factor [Jatrophihabitantaceae bacterium]|nr:RNA polymerase sigma factor [Jatrophihabitantaceae bacterium]
MVPTETERAQFAAMFAEMSPRVFAYVRRHCDSATAQDIVSDTFLVAWRRWSQVPAAALPWLFVVARNTIANRQRHAQRQYRLAEAVASFERLASPAHPADADLIERETVLSALAELTELEREALLLVAWDGLSAKDAARVCGCSVRAFEVRLSRARTRLVRAMTDSTPLRDRSVPHGRSVQIDADLRRSL